MGVILGIPVLARMPHDESTLRIDGRRVGGDRRPATGSRGRSGRTRRGQPTVRQCGDLDRAERGAMARSAGTLRPVELGVSAVQSLGQDRRLAARVPRPAGSRPGSTDARFDRDSCASACGGVLPQKESCQEALGRSRGGYSSKLHVSVDAQGQPVEVCLGPGQEHDVTRAGELLAKHEPKAVIADKAYDADELVDAIEERGAQVVIPPRANRTQPRKFSKRRYK